MKKILTAFILLFSIQSFCSTQSVFLNDCITTFSNLDKATIEFQSILKSEKEKGKIQSASMKYVSVIMESQNNLLPHTKSQDENIITVSNDLRSLMNDLVKENYTFIQSLSANKDNSKTSLEFSSKIDFVTGFFKEISLGICMGLVDNTKQENENFDHVKITKKEHSKIENLLVQSFGKSVKNGQSSYSKTAFEHSAKMIYEFLQLPLEFKKE